MNIKERVREIMRSEIGWPEKIDQLRALTPGTVGSIRFDGPLSLALSTATPTELEAFKEALNVAEALHQLIDKEIPYDPRTTQEN